MASYPECPLPHSQTCLTFLTRGQSIGLTVATIVGFVSSIAALSLFVVIVNNAVRMICRSTSRGMLKFFRSPLDVYMCSLLASDFLQGLGKVFHIRWLHGGVVQCGGYCTAQGVTQQLGETGVAQGTLAIAVHTFIMIFFRRGSGSNGIRVACFIVAAIWMYVILFATVGAVTFRHGDDRYITPVPYWCWIGTRHLGAQLAGEYIWMWLSAVVSLVLYIPLYLCLRGYIEVNVNRDRWWDVHVSGQPPSDQPTPDIPEDRTDVQWSGNQASFMLLYPMSYFILVLPDSICRWMEFRNQVIPSAGVMFGTSVFGLSGIVNVVLFLYTRPGFLLLNEPTPEPAPIRHWGALNNDKASTASEDVGVLRLRTVHPQLRMPEN